VINAQEWFGEEDARNFIQHGDSISGISRQAIGLEAHFFVVSPASAARVRHQHQ
jgi:hypothetical protein